MPEDLEELLRTVANLVYERVKHQSFSYRIYEKEISVELTDRDVIHEVHKKVYDERKGKYKFIDLWFPVHRTFVKIKSRKYITRTEINELKDEEMMMGTEGMIINFYNGITFRFTNSSKMGSSEYDPLSLGPEISRAKSRMTLPQLSGSTGRLSDMNDSNYRGNKLNYKTPLSVLPINGDKEAYSNANKIFSISCAAFFLSEGNRKEFSTMFNDLLESMKFNKIDIPSKFLEGENLKAPDGELAKVLQKAFADHRNSKSSKERSSGSQSGEEAESDLHYVGFNNGAEK